MMKDLQATSDYTAVSFKTLDKPLTKGQKMLLELLVHKQKAQEQITKSDIRDLYIKALHPSGVFGRWESRWDSANKQWVSVWCDIDMTTAWETGFKSIQWFKTNLATCIIKGKIIAIPVIDL